MTTKRSVSFEKAQNSTPKGESDPLLNDPQTQFKIIQDTGILKKSTASPSSLKDQGNQTWDVLLDSVLLTLPLWSLSMSLDYLVHSQYDFINQFWTYQRFLYQKHVPNLVFLFFFIYYTSLYKSKKWMQFILALIATSMGVLVIHITSDPHQTFGYFFISIGQLKFKCQFNNLFLKRLMTKAPGMAILWIYAIIQLDLTYALVTLGACALYYHKDYALKTFLDPSSDFMKLKF